ncbi:molybdate transport system ATP-binding protein [Novosphingobium sp. SG751A]|uniref:molybdenum ABC transporter ATP-binding protein n=1 Tax=Novosphingobium sp. SG751A TaxID=2587000 RepID=UPI001554D5AD|nr:ATP-binding cassette domain-containing protein [Novosphingobium sp. SG751A]NOW48514.1 molybdate transport system ATP-binding protein [Novosphingobium sp. SG751A]
MGFDIDVFLQRGGGQIVARFSSGAALTALSGPSGSGKTSLLDMVAGLVRPDAGRIAVDGKVLFDSAAGVDLPPHKRHCGYVFQDYRLFPHRHVEANLLYGWQLAAPRDRWISLSEVCELLGIGHLLRRMPGALSGGEKQRVAIGRALLSGARFLLMDEPLSSLDALRRAEIMVLIERIRDDLGLPILYVSHDRNEVTRLAGQIVHLGAAHGVAFATDMSQGEQGKACA